MENILSYKYFDLYLVKNALKCLANYGFLNQDRAR